MTHTSSRQYTRVAPETLTGNPTVTRAPPPPPAPAPATPKKPSASTPKDATAVRAAVAHHGECSTQSTCTLEGGRSRGQVKREMDVQCVELMQQLNQAVAGVCEKVRAAHASIGEAVAVADQRRTDKGTGTGTEVAGSRSPTGTIASSVISRASQTIEQKAAPTPVPIPTTHHIPPTPQSVAVAANTGAAISSSTQTTQQNTTPIPTPPARQDANANATASARANARANEALPANTGAAISSSTQTTQQNATPIPTPPARQDANATANARANEALPSPPETPPRLQPAPGRRADPNSGGAAVPALEIQRAEMEARMGGLELHTGAAVSGSEEEESEDDDAYWVKKAPAAGERRGPVLSSAYDDLDLGRESGTHHLRARF